MNRSFTVIVKSGYFFTTPGFLLLLGGMLKKKDLIEDFKNSLIGIALVIKQF